MEPLAGSGEGRGSMRISTGLLTDRRPWRRPAPQSPATHPYRRVTEPAQAVDEALFLADAEQATFERTRPTFTPAPARPTGPIPRVQQSSPVSRARAFVADKASLPVFAAVTRAAGWQGLHMTSRPAVHQRWTTERWMDQVTRATDMAFEAAMAEVDARISAARAQAAAGRPLTTAPVPVRQEGWLREALAEATRGAHRWYTGRDEGRALWYESLHDDVVSSPDDNHALGVARAYIGNERAYADDLTGPSGILAGPLATGMLEQAGGAR
jgi:hypothetical protein